MYANNQRLYIGMITHTEDGAEAFADMTVNLPGYSLDPGEAFISGDISKDLLRFIKENKLGKVLPYQVRYKVRVKKCGVRYKVRVKKCGVCYKVRVKKCIFAY